jgi:hypothetical protein
MRNFLKKFHNNKLCDTIGASLAFIAALLNGQEIFYLFHFSSYYLNISSVFNFLIFVFYCLIDFKGVINGFRYIGKSFYILFAVVLLSLINAAFFAGSISIFLITVKSILIFCLECGLSVIVYVLLKKYAKAIGYGLLFSFVLNFVFSFSVYFIYKKFNYVVTFSSLVPQNSFYVPHDSTIQVQGFFREPAHFTNYLVVSFFLLLAFFRSKKVRFLAFLMTISLFVLSGSGNIVVLFAAFLFLASLSFSDILLFAKNLFKNKKRLWVFVGLLFLIFSACAVVLSIPSISKTILLALHSINPFDASNTERFNHVFVAFEVIRSFPFGVGYGLSSVAVGRLHPEFSNSAIMSKVLSFAAETGPFGISAYFYLFISLMVTCIKKGIHGNGQYLCVALFCVLVLETINGMAFSIHFTTLGLAFAQIAQTKKSDSKITIKI